MSRPFISFQSVITDNHNNTPPVDAISSVSRLLPVYSGLDNELSVISKKLIKKDVITKRKAVVECIDYIQVTILHYLY